MLKFDKTFSLRSHAGGVSMGFPGPLAGQKMTHPTSVPGPPCLSAECCRAVNCRIGALALMANFCRQDVNDPPSTRHFRARPARISNKFLHCLSLPWHACGIRCRKFVYHVGGHARVCAGGPVCTLRTVVVLQVFRSQDTGTAPPVKTYPLASFVCFYDSL
jgi:hypothetical protein